MQTNQHVCCKKCNDSKFVRTQPREHDGMMLSFVKFCDCHPARTLHERVTALLAKLPSSACKGCSETVYWINHGNGKTNPYNADLSSHFTTCPNVDRFSKNGRKNPR